MMQNDQLNGTYGLNDTYLLWISPGMILVRSAAHIKIIITSCLVCIMLFL